jgi:hypothetical protein
LDQSFFHYYYLFSLPSETHTPYYLWLSFQFFFFFFLFLFHISKTANPPPQGVNLDCCFDPDNFISHIKTSLGACDDNSACAKLGVMGTCCDTTSSQTVQLDCCSDEDNKVGLHTALSLSLSPSLASLFSRYFIHRQRSMNEYVNVRHVKSFLFLFLFSIHLHHSLFSLLSNESGDTST